MVLPWNRLFAGAAIVGASLLAGCGGAVCGNGELEEGEVCDDANAADGDGCSAACAFEARVNDYRISELTLIDEVNVARFNNPNLLIDAAINANDPTLALNVLIALEDPNLAATTVTFGPGLFNAGDGSFDFATDLGGQVIAPATVAVTISGDALSFDNAADILLPIEVEVGSGNFQGLPIQDALITSLFDHQGGNGNDVTDLLSEGIITAKVALLDLCALNIVLNANQPPVNLLDVFDDGAPGNGSSTTTPPGDVPDATNCVPCSAGLAGCVIPEDNGLDGQPGTGDELYNVTANFEAEGNVTIN
jgi:cysteine-rich repeat protein